MRCARNREEITTVLRSPVSGSVDSFRRADHTIVN